MGKVKIALFGYLGVIFLLFLYSFTQVDLGLTLTKLSVWQNIQRSFQYIGYFNRPFSTLLYSLLLVLIFGFYGFILYLISKNKIKKKQLWAVILITAGVLVFAYNAFSYDIFNYIFDAKIVTAYHSNPYIHKALDYPQDPMRSFMHWIERNYPYGPIWLVLTVPLSYIGFQFFLPTFFLFKALAAVCFVGTSYFISLIVKKVSQQNELFSLALFALNPLVVIESLVSGHNDTAMMFFAVLGFYFLSNSKNIRGFFMLILSIGVKFATVFLTPVFIFAFFSKKLFEEKNVQKTLFFSSLLMIIPVVLASIRTNFQPWYLLFWLPFAALLGKKYYAVIPIIVMSLFALLEYIPFFYLGNWNNPIPTILVWLTLGGLALSVIMILVWKLKGKHQVV